MDYVMTRRLVRASKGSIKVNLDPCFPFRAGDTVWMLVEDPDGPRREEGRRLIYKSGNSMSAVIPARWGFKVGDLVRVTLTEERHDHSRGQAQEGDQDLPEQQGNLLGDSARRGVRQVRGPRSHRLLQGPVHRHRGQDLRGSPERHPGGPPEGDRGVGRDVRHSPQHVRHREGPHGGGRPPEKGEEAQECLC